MNDHKQQKDFDIFLSYQRDLEEEAKKLYKKLSSYKLSVWLDRKQVTSDSNRLSEIVSGIKSSKLFVCCVTQKYAEDKDCENELSVAYDSNKKIVVVMFEDSKMADLKGVGFKIARLKKIAAYKDSFFTSSKLDYFSPKFDEFLKSIEEELKRDLKIDHKELLKEKADDVYHSAAKLVKNPLKPLHVEKLGKLLH